MMKGPWEQYQSEETGPWTQYQNISKEESEEVQPEPKEATVGGEAVKGFKRMGSAYQTLVGSITGDTEAATRAAMKREEEFTKEHGQARGLNETRKAYEERGVLGAGAEVASQIPTALSGQAANLVTMGAGAKAGALAGTPFGGPVGAGVGAALGAIATQIVPFYEQNLIAQLRAQEERGEKPDLNRAKAAAYAAIQSSAEVGGTVLAFGKKLIGSIVGAKPAAEATEALVKTAQQSLLAASGKGAVRSTGTEIPVEMAQTILQRHQAGESLTDDDALEDYKNTIYGTILVAGPLGAGAGPVNRMQARSELDRRELAKTQTEDAERELGETSTESELPPGAAVQGDELESKIAAVEATSTDFVEPTPDDLDGFEDIQAGTTPADQSYAPGTIRPDGTIVAGAPAPAPGTIMPDGTIIAGQGDQDANGQPIAGGTGVSAEVSGQPGGVPAAGVGGVDGTGVAVVGDTGAPPQAGTAGQPSALTVETPVEEKQNILNQIATNLDIKSQIEQGFATPVTETPVPAPIKTATDTGMEVTTEQKIAKPIKFVAGYTPTVEPSVSNFLNQNSTYGQEAPLTVDRGIRMAAADQAFDSFDSAQGKVLNRLRVLANAKNKQEGVEGKYSFERPFEFMSEGELVSLYKENAGAKKTFTEGGKARLDAAKNRAAFIESLTPEQRTKFDADLDEMFNRTVVAEASGRREATESDQRKQRVQQEKRVGEQQTKAVTDVQEQVAEANKTPEQIEAEERADAEAFTRQQEADKDKSDTADALKSEAQVETEAKTEAIKEAKEKKVSTRDKRLMSAVNESGDIKSVLEEIANDKESSVGMLARNLLKVFKYLNITDPTENRISFGKVPKGKDGMFSPKADHITLAGSKGVYTGKRDLAETLMHEIMHHHIDHIVDNREAYLKSLPADARKDVQAALNRLDINYKRAKTALGDKFDISTLKEFIAETFSNRDFQQALIRLDADGKSYKVGVQDNLFRTIIKNIISALGISPADRGVVFKETIEDVMHLISVPYDASLPAKSVSYSTAKASNQPAQMGPSKPVSMHDHDDLKYTPEKFKTEGLITRIAKMVTPSSLVKKFQNDKHMTKTLENQLDLSGKLIMSGDKRNDAYTIVSLARGLSKNLYNEKIYPNIVELEKAFNELTKLTGLPKDKLIAMIDKVSIAKHEPERRMVKFLKTAPLRPQMADVRKQIFELLDSPTQLTDAQIKRLRAKLDSIMFEFDQNGQIKIGPDGFPVVNKTNVTPLGFSPRGFQTTDVGHTDYTVVQMEAKDIANVLGEYQNYPHKAVLDKLLAAQQKIINGTKELNQAANYASTPVMNLINFYGWDNYVPMKARFELDSDFDPERRGREEQESQYSFEGMNKVPDSPLLYVMSDGARAASRAGREGYTLAIKNLVGNKDKPIAGEVKKVPFAERDASLKNLKKANTIFHYNKDGSVDVITIKDKAMVDSLRRTYKDSNPLVDVMNTATGFVGKMHTRWNYAFAPMNFVRDALTNSFVLGADFGPGAAAEMLGAMASKVAVQGGLVKAMKIALMYENGDIKGMKAAAAKDGFSKTIVEYLLKGGATAYTSSIALKDQMQELNKELGRGRIIKTRDQFEKFVDVWNNMFEFSSRAAAYGVVKDRLVNQQGMTEADAAQRAVGYVKNLANFEQTGEYGKLMGGLFMFFRPAATGAVRAIEAIAPAFPGSLERAVKALPVSIQKDTAALDRFKQQYALKQRNARIMATSLLGLGAAIYAMAATMAPEDELGRNSVHADNMKQWNRYARFHIPDEIAESLGMGKNVVFQIPWGFGLGAFAAAGGQIMGAAMGRGTVQDAMQNIFTDIALDSFIPLPVSKMDATENPINFIIDSISPSIARPLLQFALNKDGLGRGIYNEPYRRMADAFSGSDRVPEAYKDASRYAFNEMGLDASPNSLYFLSNSYFDGVGRLLETAYGTLGLSGEKPRNIKQESLIFGSFFGNKGNVDNREFGQIQSQLMKKQANLNAVKSDPIAYAKYMERNPMDEVLVKSYLKDVNGELKKLQSQAKQIRMAPSEMLSPKERQEMLEPNLLMQRLIKANLVEKYKAYDIKP